MFRGALFFRLLFLILTREKTCSHLHDGGSLGYWSPWPLQKLVLFGTRLRSSCNRNLKDYNFAYFHTCPIKNYWKCCNWTHIMRAFFWLLRYKNGTWKKHPLLHQTTTRIKKKYWCMRQIVLQKKHEIIWVSNWQRTKYCFDGRHTKNIRTILWTYYIFG